MLPITFPVVLYCLLGAFLFSAISQTWVKIKYPNDVLASGANSNALLRIYLIIPVLVFWSYKSFQFTEDQMFIVSYIAALNIIAYPLADLGTRLGNAFRSTIPANVMLAAGAHFQNFDDKSFLLIFSVVAFDTFMIYCLFSFLRMPDTRWS